MKDYVVLNTGAHMPIFGLGTFQSKADELEAAVDAALSAGYKMIDTAFMYHNEHNIGKIIKQHLDSGKIKREDLFVVTKLPCNGHNQKRVPHFLKKSLENLQLDYVDLYLVHIPVALKYTSDEETYPICDGKVVLDHESDILDVWKGMEECVTSGMAKAIGLSNFNSEQIQRIWNNAKIKPANLQVECHAYFPQNELFAFCKNLGISMTAYCPIGSPGLEQFFLNFGINRKPRPSLIKDPALTPICEKYNKSPAQVLLRWLMQRGIAVIPKSTNPGRVRENVKVFDFSLSPADEKVIQGINQNCRYVPFTDPPGMETHHEYPFNIPY